jgi:tetratricopeptide (TPR) repeat protein
MGRNFEGATQLADALFVLKKHVDGYEDPRIEADFQDAARAYRENPAKFEFPETARRFRVVAEAAVRDKDFEKAVDSYAEALRLVPWWPEGRFNLALILGELRHHAEAAREMKRYLVLVPNAPNARAAQDKIYEWEDKAGRAK